MTFKFIDNEGVNDIYEEDGITYTELNRQEYSGNNCKLSSGFCEGGDLPEVDTIYLRCEKDGVEPTVLCFTPDEAQAVVWLVGGSVWSHLMDPTRIREGLARFHRPAPTQKVAAVNNQDGENL